MRRREHTPVERTVRALIAALLSLGVVLVWGLFRLDDLVHDEQAEDVVEDAERCVDQHARVDLLRGMVERSTGAGAHSAVVAVGHVAERLYEPDSLPPDLIDQLAVEADVEASAEAELILADYPDPDCDLDAARRALED